MAKRAATVCVTNLTKDTHAIGRLESLRLGHVEGLRDREHALGKSALRTAFCALP
jgi:hypothetical protein